jgi:hypothetical protein
MAEIPFVVVSWEDAWGDSTEAVFPNDAHEKHKPFGIQTYGWLLVSDDIGLSVFSEKCDDGSYRGRSLIPRAMIKEVKSVSLTKKRGAPRAKRPVAVPVPNKSGDSSEG